MDYGRKIDALLEAVDRFTPGAVLDHLAAWDGFNDFCELIIDEAIASGNVISADDPGDFMPDKAVVTIRDAINKLQWGDSGDAIAEMLGELIDENPTPPSTMQKIRGG